MTHGMNFILVNAVWRERDDRRRVRWVARAGVGPTLPHAESRVAGREREDHEWGGAVLQFSPGLEVRLMDRLRVTGEYKLMFAQPTVAAAGGTIAAAARNHNVALGLVATF
jgi:hypothetical protein